MNLHTLPRRLIASVCALGALTAVASAAEDLDRARTAYAEWARVKSQISAEQSDWRREKALMADTLSAAQAELSALDERIAELHDQSTEADKHRADVTSEITAAKATAEALVAKIAEAEAALKALLPVLPAPLLAELQPVLQRLPTDSAATNVPVSQRVQTIAVILGQIEKFNSNYAIVSEIRDLGSGRSVEVKTLYLGLATAFFADASGTTAGYGSAGASGWEWKTADAETAGRIALAIAIHENTKPPAFVSLPVEIH